MATPAYDRGRLAFEQGRDESACPYHDTAQRQAWVKGWKDAKQQAKGR